MPRDQIFASVKRPQPIRFAVAPLPGVVNAPIVADLDEVEHKVFLLRCTLVAISPQPPRRSSASVSVVGGLAAAPVSDRRGGC